MKNSNINRLRKTELNTSNKNQCGIVVIYDPKNPKLDTHRKGVEHIIAIPDNGRSNNF